MNKFDFKNSIFLGRGTSREVHGDGVLVKKMCVSEHISHVLYNLLSADCYVEYQSEEFEDFNEEIEWLFENSDLSDWIIFLGDLESDYFVIPETETTQEIMNEMFSRAKKDKRSLELILTHVNGINQQIVEYDTFVKASKIENEYGECLQGFLTQIHEIYLENGLPVIIAEQGEAVNEDSMHDEIEEFIMTIDFFVEHGALEDDFHNDNIVSINNTIKLCDYGFPSIGLY